MDYTQPMNSDRPTKSGRTIWRDTVMANLLEVEALLTEESMQCAQRGDYNAARMHLALAERTRSTRMELDGSRPTVGLRSDPDRVLSAPTSGFPRFWVEHDVLRKEGQSRGGQKTYVHGIPRGVFDKVIAKLKELAAHQQEFTVRQFVASMEMPEYHPYITLAALESLRLLVSRKRGVMKFVDCGTFTTAADQAWSTIASRPAPPRA
jgi:hypothetical protein